MPTTSSVSLDPESLEAVRTFLVERRTDWRTALNPAGAHVANELTRAIKWCECQQEIAYAALDAELDDRISLTPAGLVALSEVA